MPAKRMLRWALSLLLIVSTATVIAQDAEETFGCEANPTGDPIGGGEGYRDIIAEGDFTVRTADELAAALKAAKPGQVIYVPDGVEIDLAARSTLSIPAGVTLAGSRGLDGSSGGRMEATRVCERRREWVWCPVISLFM